jgi:hypothetical protein
VDTRFTALLDFYFKAYVVLLFACCCSYHSRDYAEVKTKRVRGADFHNKIKKAMAKIY